MDIQKVISNAWAEIKNDYDQKHLLWEWALQSAFYHHIRTKVELLWGDNLRVFPEFCIYSEKLNKNQFIDIAIVSLNPTKTDGHLSERVGKIHALIEIKYQFGGYALKWAVKDMEKLEELRKGRKDKPDCFMVYICEYTNEKHGEESMLKNWTNVKVLAMHENIKK